jgi:hypothetical protein
MMAGGDKANPGHGVSGNGNGRGPRSDTNGHTSLAQEKDQITKVNDACVLAHLLRIQDSRQDEILRGRTTWLPKVNHTNSQM